MKPMCPIVAVLCVAVTGPSLLATPGVTPTRTSASGSYIGKSYPSFDPATSMKAGEKTAPGGFGSGSSAERGAIGENRFAVSFAFNDKFFFTDPASLVDYIQLSGSARALSESTTLTSPIEATATSFADAYFVVTEPVAFRLTGRIATDQSTAAGSGWRNSIVGFRFYVVPGDLWIGESLSDPVPASRTVEEGGILTPGQYTFQTYASVAAITTGPASLCRADVSYDLRLEFTPLPTPGSLGILALAGLIAPRRRR